MSVKINSFSTYQSFSLEDSVNNNSKQVNSVKNVIPKPKFEVPSSVTVKTTKGESVEDITKRILKKMTSQAGLDGTTQQADFVEKYKNIGISWTDQKLDKTPKTGLGLGKDDIETKSMSVDVSSLVSEVKSLQKEYIAQGGTLKGGQDYTYPKAGLSEGVAGKNGIDNSKYTRQYVEQLARNAGILNSIFGEPTKLTDLKHFNVKEINVPGYSKEDNALASLIEEKYGKGNLWADKKAEILEIAKSNGVKIENLKTNDNGTVSFDLSVENILKLQHAYIGVQEKFNIDKARADEAIANHPIQKFAQGVVDGAWEDLKANWHMVTNPWQTIKDVSSGAWELGKLGVQLAAMPEMQRNALFAQLTVAGVENLAKMPVSEAAYKLGKLVGMAAVELVLAKGVGAIAGTGLKALQAIKGTEFGKTLMSSAINMAKDIKQTVGNIPIPKGVKVVEIALEGGNKLRFPTLESAKLGDVSNQMLSKARKVFSSEVTNIPQGFSKIEFQKFAKSVRQLAKSAELPEGELVIQGSRVKGTARISGKNISDVDIALRVDEKTFFDFAQKRLESVPKDTKLYKTLLKAARKGKLSRFDISPEFNKLLRQFVEPNSQYKIDFSIIKKGSQYDTGPFTKIGGIK